MPYKHVCGSTTGYTCDSSLGLRQVCVLGPLLINIFFAAINNAVYTRFKEEKNITDASAPLRKIKGAGERKESNHRRTSPGEVDLGRPLR